jgi:multimeric flavodoxin WrbA
MNAYVIYDGEFESGTYEALLQSVGRYLENKGFVTEAARINRGDLAFCMGCFGCWVKKPGECVITTALRRLTANR